MIKAIAIDDEPLALKIIENFCKQIDFISLEKTFIKPHEALYYLSNNPIDLLFLDIKMPSVTGIDIAKTMTGKYIVFTTAYSEYAVEGFDLSAVDYLLKPFTFNRFERAMAKVRQFKSVKESAEKEYLFIKADYALNKVALDDILYIEGLDDYLKIHLQSRKPLVVRSTMKGMYEQLPSDRFTRVHRSFIIPLKRIIGIKNKIIQLPELEIPIGSSFEEAFSEAFKRFI